jgi:hypothetical protein
VSYLTCPRCGLTLFDRNPLITQVSRRPCPRCADLRRSAELEPSVKPYGGAAASVLRPSDALDEAGRAPG